MENEKEEPKTKTEIDRAKLLEEFYQRVRAIDIINAQLREHHQRTNIISNLLEKEQQCQKNQKTTPSTPSKSDKKKILGVTSWQKNLNKTG